MQRRTRATVRRLGSVVVVATVLAAGLGTGLTGCSSPKVCVSWAMIETPRAAFNEAAIVVVGTLTPTGNTVRLFGEKAAVYDVGVSHVLKGDLDEGALLTIASTPPTCSGEQVYPDGDPLDTDDEVVLFLNSGGDRESNPSGSWHTITPYAAALPVTSQPATDAPALEDFLGE